MKRKGTRAIASKNYIIEADVSKYQKLMKEKNSFFDKAALEMIGSVVERVRKCQISPGVFASNLDVEVKQIAEETYQKYGNSKIFSGVLSSAEVLLKLKDTIMTEEGEDLRNKSLEVLSRMSFIISSKSEQ